MEVARSRLVALALRSRRGPSMVPRRWLSDGSKKQSLFDRFNKFARVSKEDEAMKELLDKEEEKEKEADASKCGDAEVEDDEDDYVDMFNPETGEWNGPRSGEPTRYGDWAHKGRTTDFE